MKNETIKLTRGELRFLIETTAFEEELLDEGFFDTLSSMGSAVKQRFVKSNEVKAFESAKQQTLQRVKQLTNAYYMKKDEEQKQAILQNIDQTYTQLLQFARSQAERARDKSDDQTIAQIKKLVADVQKLKTNVQMTMHGSSRLASEPTLEAIESAQSIFDRQQQGRTSYNPESSEESQAAATYKALRAMGKSDSQAKDYMKRKGLILRQCNPPRGRGMINHGHTCDL